MPGANPDPSPASLAGTFSPAWLSAQRWFRGKSLGVIGVSVADEVPLGAPGARLLVLTAEHAGGRSAPYLVPVVETGGAWREAADGEGAWRAIAGLVAGAERASGTGTLVGIAGPHLSDLLPTGAGAIGAMRERRFTAEQTNTSVAIGDRMLLKLYRLLEPGTHPELEMNAFLAEVGFAGVPRLGGSVTYLGPRGEESAVAMLQELFPADDDAWAWVLARLAGDEPEQLRAAGELRRIGGLTRELHDALASRPEEPGFPVRTATAAERAEWSRRARDRLTAAIEAVAEPHRERLRTLAPAIDPRLAAIGAQPSAVVRVTRVHGDLHLGQVLYRPDRLAVVDFEGEPVRSLDERRRPDSPLRDVAGMLRSIDYVACVAWPKAPPSVRRAWVERAEDAFRDGYGAIPATEEPLLRAFELERACYEVVYEANHRPDWVEVPLAALERLSGS